MVPAPRRAFLEGSDVANIYDQFDPPKPIPAAPANSSPSANPYDQFDEPAATTSEPSTMADVGASFAAGVPRGLAETAMTPITLNRLSNDASGWVFDKAEGPIRSLFGMDPASPGPEREKFKDALFNPLTGAVNYALQKVTGNDSADIRSGIYSAQDEARNLMDATLYKPKTGAGKFAGTIAEFATPGGLPGKASREAPNVLSKVGRYAEEALGNVLLPAVTSEAAGQATEGTQYEGLSRFLGALFGNAGAAAARTHNAPEAVVQRATDGLTEADWTAAQRLQNNSTGIRLSGPEAISQARGGASKLTDILRIVEGSQTGGAITGPFFAQRPAQVDNAVGGVLDQIAPQSPQPSTLGPRAAEAAGNVIDQTRQGINDQTRPLYQAAETQLIPDAEFATIQADPRFAAAYERLKSNPEIPEYKALPPNSIAVVDAVTKDMAARGEALSNSANPLYGPELAAKQKTGAADARSIATQQSPEYAQALAEQEALRRTQLNPLEAGPVGNVAKATDTATASNAILPQNPLAGSAGEAADATARLAAQDPETAAGLVRQNLADRYSAAQTETQGGSREGAGAKFHKSVAGNDQRREVLDAVLRALPGGQASAPAMASLLEVLNATMRRQGPGSATEFNRQIADSLGGGSILSTLVRPDLIPGKITGLLTNAGDAVRRVQLGRNVRTLADLFVDPQSVDLVRDMANRRPVNGYGDAAARTALEVGQTLYAPQDTR